jgi:hypothetical protein
LSTIAQVRHVLRHSMSRKFRQFNPVSVFLTGSYQTAGQASCDRDRRRQPDCWLGLTRAVTGSFPAGEYRSASSAVKQSLAHACHSADSRLHSPTPAGGKPVHCQPTECNGPSMAYTLGHERKTSLLHIPEARRSVACLLTYAYIAGLLRDAIHVHIELVRIATISMALPGLLRLAAVHRAADG